FYAFVFFFFFFQAEDGIRDGHVTGVQTCALPISFVESGINMVHHMMVELYSFDDVGQGYDLALGDPERIGVTLGRHSGDYVTSRSEERRVGKECRSRWGLDD